MSSVRATAVPARPRPRPAARPRPPLRVAPDVRRRRRRIRILGVVAGVVVVGSLFTLVGFRVAAAQSAFTLDKLAKERTQEQQRYERLRDAVARASSPAAVIAAATKLGMVPATGEVWLQAPGAAASTPSTNGASSNPTASYDKTKPALAQNP